VSWCVQCALEIEQAINAVVMSEPLGQALAQLGELGVVELLDDRVVSLQR
jgi:hypothetical protein